MLEILKVLGGLLTGGLMGAVLTEWFRRRHGRVQRIPLIERVNREVNPDLQGIILARKVGSTTSDQKLEELKNLREYQLTMRNTSSIHLQDAEVQFEFPADDVQAWVERPSLSKTALVEVDATATAPWKKAFRWRIPHLPSGDSVEFTFRAVDPSSDAYEAALYHTGVVFERKVGEPPPRKDRFDVLAKFALASAAGLGVAVLVSVLASPVSRLFRNLPEAETLWEPPTEVRLAGCDLIVSSNASTYSLTSPLTSPQGQWVSSLGVQNVGELDCVVRSEGSNLMTPETIPAGAKKTTEAFSEKKPQLVYVMLSVSSANFPPATRKVSIYAPP
jgi:hypothetical protein